LKPDEAERLIEASARHLRPLVIFLLGTGARVGEALWLDWANVNLDNRQVTFPKTKNGEARSVPLHGRVVDALAALPRRNGEVFLTDEGKPYARPTREADTSAESRIHTAFASACRRRPERRKPALGKIWGGRSESSRKRIELNGLGE